MNIKMKDSGVEWIGEVPEEWEIGKLKNFYDFFIGTTPDTGNTDYYGDEDGFTWITISDMNEDIVSCSNQIFSNIYVESKHPKKTVKGSLLYSFKLSVGKTAFAGEDLYTNEAIATFPPSNKVNLKYLRYQSFLIQKNAETNIYGAKILNSERIKNSTILYPPLAEQKKIADFLDDKTDKINKASELIRKEIEILKSYKQSLIYETVTKGLDRNVKYKDSGVEWIGEVPEGWKIVRLKDYIEFQTGSTPKNSIGVNQLGMGQRWFKPSDFQEGSVKLKFSENYIEDAEINKNQINLFPKNTVLFVGIASIGKVGISREQCYSNQQITAFLNKGKLFPNYLVYLVCVMSKYIKETALYTVVPIVNNQYLSSLKVILPLNIKNQKTIADFLDDKTNKIDKIIEIKEKQLQNLLKQRESLIYYYVTGKKCV